MKRLYLLVIPAFGLCHAIPASAEGGNNGTYAPTPTPSSASYAAVDRGALQAGAGGIYEPVVPTSVASGGTDPEDPRNVLPAGANPQGSLCPTPNAHIFHITASDRQPGMPSGSIVRVFVIYPTFTANKQGGYDGHDAAFGYDEPNAIPATTATSSNALDAPATSSNLPGHVIGVPTFIETYGRWQDAHPTPPYGGSCVGATFSFGAPFLAGIRALPAPAAPVLNTPPFAVGSALLAEVDHQWRLGGITTLPGPERGTTYVHIPTCAWLNSDVPISVTQLHALKTTLINGFMVFLTYNVTLTPGVVSWDWGDGQRTLAGGPNETPPQGLPVYDPTSQIWTNPCEVSHAYDEVSPGRLITATESFTASITVSWSDGISVHTEPVACDVATEGPCALTIGPSQGWQSGPHPVEQIEPVPYDPSSS